MTSHFISETSGTSEESEKPNVAIAATSIGPEGAAHGRRRGILLAGLVLWAALTSAGATATAPIENYFLRRDQARAESSTAEVPSDPELLKEIADVFEQGASEFFQDGMHSQFSRSLISILTQHGRAAFQAIGEYIFSGDGNPDVVSESLRWLSDFDDPATLPQRWAILERTLTDHSPRVRDGAILGFAALDDPRARPLLLETQSSEQIPELRRLIQQVVKQLDTTHATIPPQR